jgi:hypothetical protein
VVDEPGEHVDDVVCLAGSAGGVADAQAVALDEAGFFDGEGGCVGFVEVGASFESFVAGYIRDVAGRDEPRERDQWTPAEDVDDEIR